MWRNLKSPFHTMKGYHHVDGHGGGDVGLGGGGQMDHNIVRLPHAQQLGEKDENFHRHEL